MRSQIQTLRDSKVWLKFTLFRARTFAERRAPGPVVTMLLRRTLTQQHRRLLNIKRVDGGVVFRTTNGLNGRQVTKTLPALWLRWNCSCNHCVQPSSGQKLLNPAQWPAQIEIEECWIADEFVRFKLKNDNHEGMIPVKELEEFILNESTRYNSVKMTYHKYPNEWIPTIDYASIHDEKGQHLLTKQVATNGYCIVQNCPTEADSVQKVATSITPIVPSIYGKTFDVVSVENANNIAYTNVELPLHMDLIYMESAPGIQYLLCRRNDECVSGGDSIIVDAYAAAEELRHKDPDAFNCLATTQIRFQKIHYERDFPVHLEWEQPHIVLGKSIYHRQLRTTDFVDHFSLRK